MVWFLGEMGRDGEIPRPAPGGSMRIAMAIERFSPHGGGAEAYAVQLARTLVSEGWEVHVFGHSWDSDPETAVFHRIPQLPRWVPPSLRLLHFAVVHRRMIHQEDFDVVLGFGNTLVMDVYQSHGGVHHLSSIRKLGAVRNPLWRSLKALTLFSSPKYHARAWIESAPFRMRQRPVIVGISDMVRQDMAEYFQVPMAEIRLVYNGIDRARFQGCDPDTKAGLRKALGFDREILFLFMAYDFRKKGVRYLIDAASKLKEQVGPGRFRVVVVGGAPSPSLRLLVRRLGLDGTLSFHGPTKEPERWYHASDVFVLPTFYDACSLVVIEAMAAGLPAITTVFNGAAGIITHKLNGAILKDPGDTDEMAGAMRRFLDRQTLDSASTAARQAALDHTIARNHREMIEIFNEVSARPRASSPRG